jgi:predicted nicotinamide N-methyase
VWEWQSVAPVIETFWQVEQQGLQVSRNLEQGNRFDVGRDTKQQEEAQSLMLDPFGLVTWPGSVVATLELMRHQALVKDRVVFVIGAGVGVEAQAAAALGAKRVIATDVHPTTLKLLEHGVQQASDIDPNCVESRIWDLFGSDDVPHEVDLIVCADVLYNDKLAFQLIKRISKVYETSDAYFVDGTAADGHNVAVPTTSMSSPGNASRVNVDLREGSRPLTPHNSSAIRKPPATLIVDSQRFCHGFEHDLNAALKRSGRRGKVAWESRYLPSFTGSGILVEEDQTYDVKARVLWIGL